LAQLESITLEPNAEKSFSINLENSSLPFDSFALIAKKKSSTQIENLQIQNQKAVFIQKNSQVNPLEIAAMQNFNCGAYHCFEIKVKNPDSNIQNAELNLKINTQESSLAQEFHKNISIAPNSEENLLFHFNKPLFGAFQAQLNMKNNDEITNLNQDFSVFPLVETLILTVSILLLLLFKPLQKRFKISAIKILKSKPALSIYMLILIVFNLAQPGSAQENWPENDSQTANYLMIQWGNIRNLELPSSEQRQSWNFEISTDSGKLNLDSHLDFENTDRTEFTQDGQKITVLGQTNNDTDGVILEIQREFGTNPLITFYDLSSGNKLSYNFEALKNENYFLNERQGIKVLASDTYYQSKRFFLYSQEELLRENLAATWDIDALLENPASPNIDTQEIVNIFSLLPATYEVFSELRPEYDLIHRIVAASSQVTVYAEPILITSLAASPSLLQIISASPSRGISFIPFKKFTFPSQDFEFSSQKIISLSLGEMLFQHDKPGKITSFVQVSDMISEDGLSRIDATNLCLIPGEIEWLSAEANNYFTNPRYCFKSNTDQAMLIERYIGDKTSFLLRPRLELKIPESISPGIYRATVTFTEIDF
jgi:hypothetical protein